MSLKAALAEYCTEPRHLSEMYQAFPEQKPSTIRGRLNENIETAFRRVAKGVYLAVNGDAKALIIEGDAWDKIKEFEDDAIDTIITDSPYSCLNGFLATGTTRKKDNKWSFETRDIDRELLEELNRVLKPGGHAFFFMPSDSKATLDYNQNFIRTALDAGFEFNKRFIWDKMAIGMGYNGRCKYEQIFFLSKGPRHKPLNLSIPDLLNHKRIAPKQRLHEAEKPVALLLDLLKFSTKEKETVLDCFAGSFSTAKAALALGIHSIGIEINPEFVNQAVQELNAIRT